MYHLILDIKEYIGSFDRKAWVRLTIYDEEFKSFAYSNAGKNRFIELFRPNYISLPKQYHGDVKESLPPIPPRNIHGRPFWCSLESFSVVYNSQFKLCGKLLSVGDKGCSYIGCSPGSYPQPIIVAAINHEDGEIGLIFPFVYQKCTNNNYTILNIGKDMMHNKHDVFDKIYYNIKDHPEIFTMSDKYQVFYYKAEHIIIQAYCLDVGSFGNIDLPTLDGLTPYEYI